MAYGNNGGNSNNQGRSYGGGSKPAGAKPAATAAATGTTKAPAIYRTGLFKPDREGVTAIGSVVVKEDVTIPAGSYINLYENEKKGENSPAFSLTVTAGKKKS